MADPTMSILWSDLFYGNGDGDVMTGPYQNIITILGGPLQRNIGTGMELLFGYYVAVAVLLCSLSSWSAWVAIHIPF